MVRLVVLGLLAFAAVAEAPPQADAVKKLAEELADATVKQDFTKVIDLTYPTLVKELGGREKAIEQSAAIMNQIKTQGFVITAFTVGEPGDFSKEGDNTFVVVPTAMEMTAPVGKIESKSYLLGISSDAGKTWRFLDGAGMQSKELRDKLLPPLPAKLKLPEKEPPRLVK